MKLEVLTDQQVGRLHNASLHILERVGVHVPHPDVLRRFEEAGTLVEGERVRIPEGLVMTCLEQAGESFTIYGRDREKKAAFGQGRRNYNSISGEALCIDDETGERRYATAGDAGSAARLADALPELTIAGAMSDPHELSPEYGAAACMLRCFAIRPSRWDSGSITGSSRASCAI
jgi:trimethylamine--corrinoid protein Co-methyltransferase